MSRHETPDALHDLLQTYELNAHGYVVTRRQPGVLIQRAGVHATLRNRGDGTFSMILPDGTDLVLARVVFALTHRRWPNGPLLAVDGDDTNVNPANLVEENTLGRDELFAIRACYEARWASINAAEEAAQRARREALAQREESLRTAAERKSELAAQNEALAAIWMGDEEDLAELEDRDREKLAAREARAAARAAERYEEEPVIALADQMQAAADQALAASHVALEAAESLVLPRRRRAPE